MVIAAQPFILWYFEPMNCKLRLIKEIMHWGIRNWTLVFFYKSDIFWDPNFLKSLKQIKFCCFNYLKVELVQSQSLISFSNSSCSAAGKGSSSSSIPVNLSAAAASKIYLLFQISKITFSTFGSKIFLNFCLACLVSLIHLFVRSSCE